MNEGRKEVLFDETGHAVAFGDLIKSAETVIVIFSTYYESASPRAYASLPVRHFYCGLCQSYVQELAAKATPEQLKAHNASIVIIGNGSWSLIKPCESSVL
jgi:hypothetical protein